MANFSKIWKRAQETTAVVSALGTLLLGIVTLWVTVKVSGLEDYFRSEIKYRNEQLVIATESVRGLEQQRSSLIKEIDQERKKLAIIEARVQDATLALGGATKQSQKLKGELDIFSKAQAFAALERAGYLSATITFQLDDKAQIIEIGKFYSDSVDGLRNDPSLSRLTSYFDLAESRVSQICKGIFDAKFSAPLVTEEKVEEVKPKSGSVQDAYAASREYSNRLVASLEKRSQLRKARSDLITSEIDKFYGRISECTCNALSTTDEDRRAICKSRKAI
jgi:hypothetical protein